MNILFITPDHSNPLSGVTSLTSQLANYLVNKDENLCVYFCSVANQKVETDEKVKEIVLPPSRAGAFWQWSPGIVKKIESILLDYHIDIVHIHSIWLAAQWAGLKAVGGKNIPIVISSHGMLEPWLVYNQGLLQRIKKELYLKLVLKPSIPTGTTIHAITSLEAKNLKVFFPGYNTVLIPNAIDIAAPIVFSKINDNSKQLLYLGRLHPKKGIELLLRSLSKLIEDPDWHLNIAGSESIPGYTNSLKDLCAQLDLEKRVSFVGPIYEKKKWEALNRSWAVIVPSYSEVVGLVNLEAAICKTPSITTFETGLMDWENGGGLLIHPTIDELTESLKKVLGWSLDERLDRGERSFQLVKENYSWDVVAQKWLSFYASILT
ncbi:MAG: glycosyltransferase [Chloroflexota bacterium]